MGDAGDPCQSYRCETPVSESTTYGKAHLTSYVRGRMGQELSKRRICAESSVLRASIPTGYDPRSRGGRLLKKEEVETLHESCVSPHQRRNDVSLRFPACVRCRFERRQCLNIVCTRGSPRKRDQCSYKNLASTKRGEALSSDKKMIFGSR